MGLIKGALKVVGTATLAVTGTASTVLKGMSDAVGLELGSTLFGATKDASFNGIRSMWGGETSSAIMDQVDNISVGVEDAPRKGMAATAKRAAEVAKKNGDMEKYEYYMEQYEQYKSVSD